MGAAWGRGRGQPRLWANRDEGMAHNGLRSGEPVPGVRSSRGCSPGGGEAVQSPGGCTGGRGGERGTVRGGWGPEWGGRWATQQGIGGLAEVGRPPDPAAQGAVSGGAVPWGLRPCGKTLRGYARPLTAGPRPRHEAAA